MAFYRFAEVLGHESVCCTDIALTCCIRIDLLDQGLSVKYNSTAPKWSQVICIIEGTRKLVESQRGSQYSISMPQSRPGVVH